MREGPAGRLEFRILGGLEAWSGEARLALGGPRERMVLAVLLLEANRAVPVSRLIDAVWDDHPPVTAAKQIRNAISRLRAALLAGGDPGISVINGVGYRLTLDEGQLDSLRFEAGVTTARAAASAGDLPQAAEMLRVALGLWRGPPLAGLPGRVAEATAIVWDERRLAAQELYLDHQLALGRHHEFVAELAALAAENPLRGRPTALLMLALHRCGRQGEALAAFAAMRARLADEMGLDPGLDLQRLHQQILTNDASIAAPTPSSHAIGTPVTPQVALPVPRQLPAAPHYFTGRTEHIKTLSELADQAAATGRTVVISAIDGTAGIGKTALAVYWAYQVADQFPDGQLYVNLRGFDPSGQPLEPAVAVRGFLSALGVPPAQVPATLDEQIGLYRSLLAGKRMLVLLDNARDAGQVRPLLPGNCPSIVLVTSRNTLSGLIAGAGATPITLGLLTTTEAYTLISRRLGPEPIAQAPGAVAELIELCARLPLALNIAAARAAMNLGRPLTEVVEQLRDESTRLDTLDTGDVGTSARTVFSWSCANLSAPTARMFRLLGLHPGPDISIPAAASLAGLPLPETRRTLGELARSHLLAEPTPGRYTLHDLLRAYATELLRGDDEAARAGALDRVLHWYLRTADAADRAVLPQRQRIPLEPPPPGCDPLAFAGYDDAYTWCQAERLNLSAAISSAAATGRDYIAWRLPAALTSYFNISRHWPEWIATHQVGAEAAARLGDQQAQAWILSGLGAAFGEIYQYESAQNCLRRALAIRRASGDRGGEAATLLNMGVLAWMQQDFQEGLALLHSALDIFEQTGDQLGQALTLNNLGEAYCELDRPADAFAHLDRALAMFRATHDRYHEGMVLHSIGNTHRTLRDFDSALRLLRQSLALRQETGNRKGAALTYRDIGETLREQGDLPGARRAWEQSLAEFEQLGDPHAANIRELLAMSRT
ncbi:MAG: hypothetical protein QOJ73_4051 [Streptosporangiaceae bacterium]|jgi:DNA-binding SARP family transcriptional activator/tetratricopeptide (TPR) repeat protein|nr:hypothetical protein [Streptosporangiaceae bacterium]